MKVTVGSSPLPLFVPPHAADAAISANPHAAATMREMLFPRERSLNFVSPCLLRVPRVQVR
jgi:hypothetical protein